MKTINLSNVDIKIYYQKLKNGLEVYLLPQKNVSDVYALFTTRYGSINSEFIPINESKMIKVPDGIAHFLEHKLFESEDGVHPFTFYNKNGADVNAFTNYFNTSYLFTGTENVEECVDYLLNYVQKPYFTDENVEKEKGIIEQELLMYKDIPIYELYDVSFKNLFQKHPVRIPVGGTPASIKKITKNDLYTCYNTFYHPSNMFITISGNFEPQKILEVIEKNQNNKKFDPPFELKNKTYVEPDEVAKKREILHMNVTIPKAAVVYKINLEKFDKISLRAAELYVTGYFFAKLGKSSYYLEDMIKSGVFANGVDMDSLRTDKHLAMFVIANTERVEDFIKQTHQYINDLKISEEEFNRKKKVFISNFILESDNIHDINSRILNSLIMEKEIVDYIKEIKDLTYEDYKYVVKNLNLSNYTELIIEPLK